MSYAAQADHLLGREDSPFWDDIRTPQKEDKALILARSLAAAISAGDSQLGGDHKAWQWGKLHSYAWKNSNGQTVRGPLAAGGDHTTLNTSAFAWGQDFNTTQRAVDALYRRLRPDRTDDGAERYRAIGQPAEPELPQWHRSVAEGAVPGLPMQPQNFEQGVWQNPVDPDTG